MPDQIDVDEIMPDIDLDLLDLDGMYELSALARSRRSRLEIRRSLEEKLERRRILNELDLYF